MFRFYSSLFDKSIKAVKKYVKCGGTTHVQVESYSESSRLLRVRNWPAPECGLSPHWLIAFQTREPGFGEPSSFYVLKPILMLCSFTYFLDCFYDKRITRSSDLEHFCLKFSSRMQKCRNLTHFSIVIAKGPEEI